MCEAVSSIPSTSYGEAAWALSQGRCFWHCQGFIILGQLFQLARDRDTQGEDGSAGGLGGAKAEHVTMQVPSLVG